MRLFGFALATTTVCLLLSCSENSNPVIPRQVTTFQEIIDIGMSDLFYGVTEGPNGTITACGKSSWLMLDYDDPPNQITRHFAQLINFTTEGDTNWVSGFSYSDRYMEYRAVTPLDEGGYIAVGQLSPFDYSWSYLATTATDDTGAISWSDTKDNSTWARGQGVYNTVSSQHLIYGTADASGQPERLTLDCYASGGMSMWDTTISAPDTNLLPCNGMMLDNTKGLVISSYYLNDLSASGAYLTFFDEDGENVSCKPIPIAPSSRAIDCLVEDGKVARLLANSFNSGTMSVVFADLDSTLTVSQWHATPLANPVNIMKGRFTSDGGAIIVGNSAASSAKKSSATIATAGTLIKLDSDGHIEWQKQFSVPEASVELNDVIEYSEGGYVAVGYVQPFASTETDYLIIKTDANGDVAQVD